MSCKLFVKVRCWCPLEEMHRNGSQCHNLVEKTAAALNEEAVMLMLLAVQRGNVELSVKEAWRWWVHQFNGKSEQGSQQKLQCSRTWYFWGWECNWEMSFCISIHLGKCFINWWSMPDPALSNYVFNPQSVRVSSYLWFSIGWCGNTDGCHSL